jgi:hypothetical protein
MAKTILELFQTQNLANGKTAEETYAIRDIKRDLETQSKNGILNITAFKGQNLLRKKLSVKGKETRFEQEVTGLNALMLLAGPGIYGTEYFRVKTKTTDSRDVMVESTRAGVGGNRGLLGGVLKFIKNGPKKLGTLLGAKFPEQMIPSRFVDNPTFKPGQSDLYDQIAKIKKDSEGNGFGRFLQKNVNGTPDQIGNQVISGAIGEGKKALENVLFGSRKAGAVRLGAKPENQRYYDVNSPYSNVVDEQNSDITLRTDLSTKFYLFRKLSKSGIPGFRINPWFARRLDDQSKNTNNKILSYAYQTPYLGEEIYNYRNTVNYLGGRETDFLNSKKPGILNVGRQMSGLGQDYLYTAITDDGLPIPYTTTVDFDTKATPVPINERNDLTTYLKGYIDFENSVGISAYPIQVQKKATRRGVGQNVGVGINDKGVADAMGNYYPYSGRNGTPNTQGYDLQRGITDYREIRNGSDLMNSLIPNASTTYTAKISGVNKTVDEIDFIRLKFASQHLGKYSYFRGTISGYSESFTPSYGQHQGIGMAYPLYTFESIERTVQFNFKVYSLNFDEHMAAWQRLQFLASLTMPQGFSAMQATHPPVVQFWLGDMFVDRTVYIENLTYTTDTNFPWDIGLTSGSSDCWKLPMIIDVSLTIHLIDEMGDTKTANDIYDFLDPKGYKRSTNPAIAAAITAQTQPTTLPNATVTSSPKKKILPTTTIPTPAKTIPILAAKPVKLADVNMPKLPAIANIKPLEMGTTETGGTPVGAGVQATPEAPKQPETPPTPIPTPDITQTPVGGTNSTTKDGDAALPTPYDVKKEFGQVRLLGKGTAASDTLAMNAAEYDAVKQARIKLAVPAGDYNLNIYEVTGDSTHLYLNRDGSYTYESVYNIQILSKRK